MTMFWAALIGTLIFTLTPLQLPPLMESDKLEHLVAFFSLTVLWRLTWGAHPPVLVLLAIGTLGGAIEVVQEISFVGREGDLLDWAADIMGILAGLGVQLGKARTLPHSRSVGTGRL
jgi:VanZ family protein